MDDLVIEKKAEPKKAATRATPAREGMVKIMIPKTKDEQRDVYVNAGFRAYQIQRGVAVDVPQDVVNTLNLAIETRYFPVEDPLTGKKTMVPQDVHSYPFQILG